MIYSAIMILPTKALPIIILSTITLSTMMLLSITPLIMQRIPLTIIKPVLSIIIISDPGGLAATDAHWDPPAGPPCNGAYERGGNRV